MNNHATMSERPPHGFIEQSASTGGPHHWVFESCSDCVMIADLGGDIVVINANGVMALELDDASTVLHRPVGQLWPGARQDTVEAALALARDGGIGHFTAARAPATGQVHWWDVTITAIAGASGMLEGLLVMARDVSQSRQSDQLLPRSLARYQSLVAGASVIEWDTAGSGQFETVQAAWGAFTGQGFDQYRGDGWLDAVHPNDRSHSQRRWAAALRGRHAYVDEHRLRSVDGHYHYMHVRAVPVIDSDGKVREWVGVHIDVEQPRGGEQRLRLLDAIGEATRNADDAATIMARANRMLGEHLGVTRCLYADVSADHARFTIRHDWLGGDAVSTVGEHALALFGARAIACLRAGQPLVIGDIDGALEGAAGAFGCQALICCPLLNKGMLVGLMAVHHDRARTWSAGEVALVGQVLERCALHLDRVRAADALAEADSRRNAFLAILAHELRNPLAPLRNGLQLMALASTDGQAMEQVRAMMERQVRQLSHLVDDLLDVARVTSGKLDLRQAHGDLAGMLAAAIETSLPLIEANGHALAIDLPQHPLPLYADPLRVAQVLSNVLDNAARYTPRGGRISVSARIAGKMVVIRVSDTGVGIAAGAHASVFAMFGQTQDAIGRAHGGLGIGLSLSRQLLELHGGSIELAGTSPAGTTFEIRLPRAAPAGVTGAVAAGASGAARQLSHAL